MMKTMIGIIVGIAAGVAAGFVISEIIAIAAFVASGEKAGIKYLPVLLAPAGAIAGYMHSRRRKRKG